MKNFKNIILDYGNVLFEIDFNRAQEAFTNLGISDIDSFFSHKGHHSIFNDLEVGKSTPEEFRNEIRATANNFSLSDKEIDDAWNSLLIGIPNDDIHQLLFELKAKYKLFLLSNNNEIHYNWIIDYLKRDFNIENYDNHFDKAYFSHQMKLRKPNLNIFEQLIKEQNINPAETLFIDDSPQHLAGAKQLGFNTLLMNVKPQFLRSFFEENKII